MEEEKKKFIMKKSYFYIFYHTFSHISVNSSFRNQCFRYFNLLKFSIPMPFFVPIYFFINLVLQLQ